MRILLIVLLLSGCANRDIKIKEFPSDAENVGACLAAPIVDTNRILKPFLVVDTNKNRIKFQIPNTPIDVDLERQEAHSFYRLAERLSQDNIAMNNALLAIVLMRNMAPCDKHNIEYSWKTMDLFIKSVARVYSKRP